MSTIALVIVSTASSPLSSEEFRYGWDQLHRILPAPTVWQEMPEPASPQAWGPALERASAAAALEGNARVLLLRHGHVMVGPDVLDRLLRALDDAQGTLSAVHAFDPGFPPALGPDYCTVRGMERYLAQLGARDLPPLPDSGQHTPLVTLTTAAAVRAGTVRSHAQWVPGAFVHDFASYHQARREDMLPLLPAGAARVLDVGGGEGGFLQAIKELRGCETHLAEYSEEACRTARGQVDHVWQGDFLTQPFAGLPGQGKATFDCISFLDVLEHANDPRAWLARARGLLAPGGSVLLSIPNVGHWGVVADLIEGRWDYCPLGIHCVTHVRFFTWKTLQDLLASAGFQVEHLERVQVPAPDDWARHWAQSPRLAADPESWNTYAFLVRATPLPEGPWV
ncbi:2-polyprenyl-3-methyl-5-hydroxy-6-metoxy-1,4-benzoquinol methylase [Acidovorax soli]|uniref:2-polyprenyl-3-methyl-5-hydroxy-6-metoxy-1, 4-benzoquinol methylase n=1 Tax=Acidovorax soli TaxID=592050 RepID=A0A7X0PEW2_9BURK|nr:class I SAM-dependent methyltransferase [Acidovorax soli]MBB6560561.1 2-polyprenyl-3-methyl-5-hydroxy-6-metoxy-1,4-benzoquinol methylase [Acidovorax soli]